MNDFSFSNVFRAAFDVFCKNFTGIFFLSLLSAAFVLFISLFLNSVFVDGINSMLGEALATSSGDEMKAFINPFLLLSLYAAAVIMSGAVFIFFLASAFLPMCKGQGLKLKNYFPGILPAARFLLSAAAVFAVYWAIMVLAPVAARAVGDNASASAGMLLVSVISFAAIAFWTVFILRYFFVFTALLENMGLKEALKKSSLITKGRRSKLFILAAVIFLINFLGKILVLALLFTLPFGILAAIYAYLDLNGEEIVKQPAQPDAESAV